MAGQRRFERVLGEICELDWNGLGERELTDLARAYYFFSIQFRENFENRPAAPSQRH
jgi:hypothetical protein